MAYNIWYFVYSKVILFVTEMGAGLWMEGINTCIFSKNVILHYVYITQLD